MEVYGIIYRLPCTDNQKTYVGQTKQSLEERFRQHVIADSVIGCAIRSHGADKFTKEILEECETPKQLNEREIFWIAKLNCKAPNGYNLTDGGEGLIGCADNTRLKISEYRRHETPYKNLLNEMDKQKLTYSALAKLLGLATVTFSDKMRGKLHFTEKDATKFIEIFGLPAEYLLERDDGLPSMASAMDKSKKISARVRRNSPYKNLLCEMNKLHIFYISLAELLNLSQGTLSEKMQGKVKFTAKDISKLVEFFNKPAKYLLARNDGKKYLRSKHRETLFKNLLAAMIERKLTYTSLSEFSMRF